MLHLSYGANVIWNREMSDCTLVVAAHPEDEVLGCGGLIARAADRGEEVRIAILAEGLTSRDQTRDVAKRADEMQGLHAVAQQAGASLGAKSVEFGGCPDNRMDSMDLLDVTKMVEQLVQHYQPKTVLTHHRGGLIAGAASRSEHVRIAIPTDGLTSINLL